MKILALGGDSDMAKGLYKSLVSKRKPYDDIDVVLLSKRDINVLNYDGIKSIIIKEEPDWVINFAGVSHVQRLKNMKAKLLLEELSVNLVGSFYVARACVDTETKRNSNIPGMIFIGSVAGKYGKPEHAGYSASKAGVISLVQSLGKEGYKAYCISPGRVNTKMREHDYPGEDVNTRLATRQIADVIFECIKGKYQPGDNLIIRKRGYETLRRTDKGEPWRTYLNLNPDKPQGSVL